VTPFERVIARRPALDDLAVRGFDRGIEVTSTEHALERDRSRDGDVDIAVGPELTRDEDITGPFSRELEWYEYGADLIALRDAGVRLSWEAAQWLYAVGRAELDEVHASGRAISTRPRAIRLRLAHTPFTPSNHDPGRYLNDGTSDDGLELPAVFAFLGTQRGTAASHVRDHALLAAAVGGLTQHSDPQIDQLLHDPDPDATHVLRDLLLERGQSIEPLLRDRANVSGLAETPLVDEPTIDDEFEALWDQVIALDPMLE
jgi:hypothetical protein